MGNAHGLIAGGREELMREDVENSLARIETKPTGSLKGPSKEKTKLIMLMAHLTVCPLLKDS